MLVHPTEHWGASRQRSVPFGDVHTSAVCSPQQGQEEEEGPQEGTGADCEGRRGAGASRRLPDALTCAGLMDQTDSPALAH